MGRCREARLPALVEASLVLRGEDGRLRLLATVREYARASLDASTEGDAVRSRHLEHYAGLAEQLAPELLGPGDTAAHGRLERERDNLRAALVFAREQGRADALLRLVRDLSRFWYVHANFAEGAEWAQTALAAAPAPSLLRAQALKGAPSSTGGEPSSTSRRRGRRRPASCSTRRARSRSSWAR